MVVAAITPRVRTIVICDNVVASRREIGVFTLKGVRYQLEAASFPWQSSLRVFLLLSSSRKGDYPGKLLIVNEQSDRSIRYIKFHAAFEEDNELLSLYVDIGNCVFPEAGPYNFEIYFSAQNGSEALKGEHPFTVLRQDE